MLTIISKFNNFRNRQGEHYTTEDLTKLSKAVITSDVIHFKGNISYGFNSTVANCIYKYIDNKYKKGKILIINDLSLHMTDKLIDEGFDINNIYLAYGKWTKGAGLDKDPYVYETMKKHIEVSFKEKLNVIKLEDIFSMQFDLIIANPPYGKIGAQITKKIIDEVDYKEFINLLPANDYKRVLELWQYQSDMESCKDAFDDAAVTTNVAKIHKNKVNTLTKEGYERTTYIDNQLTKYFNELATRTNVFKDVYLPTQEFVKQHPCTISAFFTKRDCSHGHAPYTKKCNSYRWNFEESITPDYLIANTAADFGNTVSIEMMVFNTALEKRNFVQFIYSENGFRFMSKLFTAVNVDSRIALSKIFPKVDWTRSWTVEEILKEYNYTEKEIKEVMEDLKNFKVMND